MTHIADLGEFSLIEHIRKWVGNTSHNADGVLLGIGDDAAIVQPQPGMVLVVTCDAQVEGRHFLPLAEQTPERLQAIGRRWAVVNLSDIAAMAAKPRFATVSLGLPDELPLSTLESLYRGLAQALQDNQVAIVGGNLTSNTGPCFVDITMFGEVEPGAAVTRAGACIGDWIGVTGFPGKAMAGLECLLLKPTRKSKHLPQTR